MDLNLDPSVAHGLASGSQIARRVTESWASNNLFCLACQSAGLHTEATNTPVRDFSCPICDEPYQLKSKRGSHGGSVANSAYEHKLAAIMEGSAPSYAFLGYDKSTWRVGELFVIPGHFFSPAVIGRRKPLRSTARRAGWVGSNILLSKMPPEARISVVADGAAVDPGQTREHWNRFRFLKTDERASEGWGADILALVREIQRDFGEDEFALRYFYEHYEETLKSLHPKNRNVRAKIRQQLQVLRDEGILSFEGRGHYRIIG